MVDRDEASFETAAAAVGDLPALLRRLDRGNQLGMLYDVEQAVAEDGVPYSGRTNVMIVLPVVVRVMFVGAYPFAA